MKEELCAVWRWYEWYYNGTSLLLRILHTHRRPSLTFSSLRDFMRNITHEIYALSLSGATIDAMLCKNVCLNVKDEMKK